MTREKLKELLSDLPSDKLESVVDKLMAENGKDITKAKSDYDTLKNEYETYKESTKDFETTKKSYEKLQKETNDYKTKIEEYQQKETKSGYVAKLKAKGIDEAFIDYAYSKIQVADKPEDYEKNVDDFIKANPKMVAENYNNGGSSFQFNGGGTPPDFSKMSDEEYLKYRNSQNKQTN